MVNGLIVDAGGSRTRLFDGQVSYVRAAAGGITLSSDPDCVDRAGFLVRLLGGWYLYIDDPASAALEIDGITVIAQATPLPHRRVRLSRTRPVPRRTLAEALHAAYPTYGALEQMLAAKCGVELRDLSGPKPMEQVTAEVVAGARRYRWLPELVAAVGGRAAAVLPRPENVVHRAAGFLNPDDFGHKLLQHSRQVCRIEVQTLAGPAHGTGFLIGPDRVLTNYHVLEPVLTGAVKPAMVRCRFGYRVLGDDVELGREAGLAVHWNLASSPPDELDYVIVRLDEPVGHDPDPARPGATRGWITVPGATTVPGSGQQLLILQHPASGPIKLAMEPEGIITVDRAGRAMTHRVNTARGSSGAPCLGFDFTLLGLHQAGFDATSNVAVPIAAIVRHLRAQGRHHLLIDS